MATYQVQTPGGAAYKIEGAPGADPAALIGALQGHNGPPAQSGGFLHDIGLGLRDIGEGAASAVTGPHDLAATVDNAARRALNRITGTKLWRPYPLWQQNLSNAITAAGAPVATTPGQKLAGSIIRGTSGALAGGGLLGDLGLANAARLALSGATAGGAASAAREAGAGPVGQTIAGAAGALLPGGAEALGRVLWRPIGSLTRAGQTQLAANTLVREAANPQTAARNLENAQELVPGSARTAGEASGDTGLLALEKGVRARNVAPFAERVSQQNAARQEALAKLGGTPADIEKAEAFRAEQTAPMREGAFAQARGVPMTLYRGQLVGGTPGYDQGGAIWTTPSRELAQRYANNTLAGPGKVERYDVVLRKPFASTPESAPELARYIEGPNASPDALENTQRWLENEGLESVSPEARQRLLDAGYDSIIAHNETLAEPGAQPSVVLLKSPEQMTAPTTTVASKVLDAEGNPVQTEVAASPHIQVETAPVTKTIDGILDSPAGAREGVSKTMKWAKNLIGDETNPERLYEVRKDLELAQRGKLQPTGRDAPNESMLAQTRGELGQVIKSLDSAIEKAAPGYKQYLERYKELSQPINQMEALQDLQKRTSNGFDTATGHPFLSAPQFARRLATTLERENNGSNPLTLTPSQRFRLGRIREDLQRGSALSSPNIRAPGSDTYQNFMAGNRFGVVGRLGNAFLHIPGLRRIPDWVDQRVNEELANAMLDPKQAATLLRQGKVSLPWLRAVLLGARREFPALTAGSVSSLPDSVTPLALPAPSLGRSRLTYLPRSSR